MSKKLKRSVTMPKATAVWLLENTKLTFKQIADFCQIHTIEVRSIADGIMSSSIRAKSPVASGEVTLESIAECEKDSTKSLEIQDYDIESFNIKVKSKTYVSLSKRQNKPSAVLWLVNNVKGISVKEIRALTGATKTMIDSIIDGSYKSLGEISAKDPVSLGICTQTQLNDIVNKLQKTK